MVPADRSHIGLRWLSGALAAATATAAPAVSPDSVRWVPPAHAAPALSLLLDPLIATVAFLAAYRFFVLPVLIIGPIFLFAAAGGATVRSARMRAGGIALFVLCGIGNIVFGTSIATALVYHEGVAGSATVTATRPNITTTRSARTPCSSARPTDG